MATETQKNFRRQMKELAEEQKYKQEKTVYSYIDKKVISNKIIYNKRKIITFSGVIGFLIIGFYVYSFFSGINSTLISNKQGEVSQYIKSTSSIEQDFNRTFEKMRGALTIQSKEAAALHKSVQVLIECKNELGILVNELNTLESFEEVEELKKVILQKYDNQVKAINLYIEGFTTRNSEKLSKGNYYMNQYNELVTKERDTLINILKENKMKYEINSNGSIRYWYKDMLY